MSDFEFDDDPDGDDMDEIVAWANANPWAATIIVLAAIASLVAMTWIVWQ